MGSKWMFKIKKDTHRSIIKYKAQLVAQEFTQVPSVDYFDIYSSFVKLASLRTILSIKVINDWEVHSINVKSAYLYSKFTRGEVIYMCEPSGYEIGRGMVLQLKKLVYGL